MRNLLSSMIIILALLVCVFFIFSDSYLDLTTVFPLKVQEKIYSGAELVYNFKEKEPLSLVPQLSLQSAIIQMSVDLEPTVGVEFILFYRYKTAVEDSAENRLKIYNILRSITSLKGIEYYSASRKKMRVFFEEAYVIDSPEKKRKIPDPLVSAIPSYADLYIYSKDSSLGENVSQVKYFYYGNYFAMIMENYATIWQFVVPAVQPGDLKNIILLIPVPEGIVFYGLSIIKTVNLFGLAEAKGKTSAYNRLKAFYTWFTSQYEQK